MNYCLMHASQSEYQKTVACCVLPSATNALAAGKSADVVVRTNAPAAGQAAASGPVCSLGHANDRR